ncbi:MAG: adenosylmethionine---8-amino-7-oxononanoate aminotransferase [Acidimicrobiaceae bacterium]|jgi:adenosylmethionine-8-amino-7-oxononanoate aminotransferase|nr:adenosylmethionine---8-amino-7-oxononanoate aminotransferase [Acidimicrobiaceae bacterium]
MRAADNMLTLVERDRAAVWHPYAALPPSGTIYPVVAAEGVRLELADGRHIIDGMASWWSMIHGYRHPVLDEAVRAQLSSMAHVMLGGLTHPAVVDLAELLIGITPEPLAHVFFADSGSVAVEVAIKMAVQHWIGRGKPQKRRLVTVRGGYHGDTFGAMAVCDPETGMHHLFTDVLAQHLFAPMPGPDRRVPFDGEPIAAMETLLAAHAHEVAAVILEPVVQGAGGMRFSHPEYLTRLRALCDVYDVLLVCDEIATGFGRTGALFASEHADIAPDILCLGKAMTGGYLSMAATLCTPAVAEGVCRADPGALMHGPTFMGNALGAAVSRASIELLLSGPWRDEVRRIEAALTDGLEQAKALPGVADVRVFGAIGVVEMHEPVDMEATQAHLVDHGVWLRPFGRLLYTMPPYVIDGDDLSTLTAAMVSAAGLAS